MVFAKHPIQGVLQLAQKNNGLVLEFSRYVHLGRGRTLSREIFHVDAGDVSTAWLATEIDNLSEGQELALHSKVTQNSVVYHIPMIDFTHAKSPAVLLEKTNAVSDSLPVDLTLYDSGQSMHGYYFCLIVEKRWYEFLGRLLLCDQPSHLDAPVVDWRWVGHSLEHHFSALRWSCNSPLYRSLPQFVETTRSPNLESTFHID